MITDRPNTPGSPAREADWATVEHSADFVALMRAKARFIVPATIFFLAYYFLLPVAVGYAPGLMETKIFGNVNLAYLFALSQFAMVWIIMVLYIRAARGFDERADRVIENVRGGRLK
ncbi:MAG: DUF485 domain-containing protein [Vulcanimicrobiaceae bacterium]